MRSGTIAFAVGICVVQLLSALPDRRGCLLLLPLLLLATLSRWLRLPALFAIGALWAVLRASFVLDRSLPPELEGQHITIAGEVIGLPERVGDATRFRFRTETMTSGTRQWPACGIVRLEWRGDGLEKVHAAERWRLQVRLKRPHGLSNPGSFDYELWLFQQRIRATGYVIAEGRHERLANGAWGIDVFRERIRDRLREAIGDHPHYGVVAALAIGARADIGTDQWRVFFRTNTGHLIAISGLHIGLVAVAGFFIGRWLWSMPARTLLWIPAQRIGALSSVAAAAGYCALAGFEVPAQRTLIMIAVVAVALWRSRRTRAFDAWMTALLTVLIVDPLAVLSVGFWLSFVAVAILLYGAGRTPGGASLWHRLALVHLIMSAGLAPLLAFFFGQHPVIGPLANLVAVPWISFIVVPLTLIGTFLLPIAPFCGYWLLRGALLALDMLWRPLERIADMGWASLSVAHPGPVVLACAAVGSAILIMPRGLPGRVCGFIWLAPLFLHAPPRPANGEFWLTVLDVGQGLSAVVRTHEHVLVFDAGPSYSDRFDTGAAVLAPYLRYVGIRAVDRLIVSHADNDHIGGVSSLIDEIAVGDVLSSVPQAVEHPRAQPCVAGQTWQWDGVVFEILSPLPGEESSENDASCVLRVKGLDSRRGALLSGDIEAAAESRIVARYSEKLSSGVVVAPHHGSASSSTLDFVQRTRPEFVVFPVGYRNRWKFPANVVVNRWQSAGSMLLRTDHDGAVHFAIADTGIEYEVYRMRYRRYWQSPRPGSGDAD